MINALRTMGESDTGRRRKQKPNPESQVKCRLFLKAMKSHKKRFLTGELYA